jgi:pilus assembly protein Flp/PilA
MDKKRDRLWNDEKGATAVEYALIASLIAGVIGLSVSVIGNQLMTIFTAAAAMFP